MFERIEELPVFVDTQSPSCVICGRTRYAKGFIHLYCNVPIKDDQGALLDVVEGYACVPCVRKLVGALPNAALDRKGPEAAQARCEAAAAEVKELSERAAGLQRAHAFVRHVSED